MIRDHYETDFIRILMGIACVAGSRLGDTSTYEQKSEVLVIIELYLMYFYQK